MVVPPTPSKPRAPVAGTPSPRKQQSMALHYEEGSKVLKSAVASVNSHIDEIVADVSQTAEAREAAIFLIKTKIDTMIISHGINFEDQSEEPPTVPQDDADFIDDTDQQEDDGHGGLTEPDLSQSILMSSTTSNKAWLQVLEAQGTRQGDGSHQKPTVVGCTHLSAALDLIKITIAPGMGVSRERAQAAATLFHKELSDLKYFGPIKFVDQWQRLHHWAVTAWVNFFFGEFFGGGAIPKLNTLLKASKQVNAEGETRRDADRALALAQSSHLTPLERTFFQSMAASIAAGLTNNDAFSRFKNNHQCAIATATFYEMVVEVTNNPAGELAQRVRIRGQSGSGKSIQDQVKIACATNMNWLPSKFQSWIDRHNVLSRCVFKFSPGFLLFVNTSMLTLARNSGRGWIEHIIEVLVRVFPEYETIMTQAYQEVALPLLSHDHNENLTVMGKKVVTGADGDDLITRIKAMKVSTQ